MVEAMQRVWTGKEPEQTAPVIRKSLTINQKQATENVSIKAGNPFTAQVDATDKEEDKLTYVWEILKEATELGFGGSYEPRPERIGKVSVTETNEYESSIETPGQYRLYVYVTDSTGFVSTTNIPFQITE